MSFIRRNRSTQRPTARDELAERRARLRSSGRDLARIKRRSVAHDPVSTSRSIMLMQEPRLFSPEQLDFMKIIHPQSQNRRLVDTFRELRTRLLGLRRGENFSMMIASVSPEGGGTFVSMNLAASIAFEDSKTSLLVDCNLQNPYFHKVLQLARLDSGTGLTDYLSDPSIGIESVVRPSGIPRLRIVPVGSSTQSSVEYFSSSTMRAFLAEAKQRYKDRFIIIDSPSLVSSADAKILANLADYIVLVIPYGRVTTSQIVAACQDIDQRKLVGTVLNNEPLAELS
ncbi:MAG: CpsD/CapB family tyrosine-protein kinase [Pseudomonadota bacterium]